MELIIKKFSMNKGATTWLKMFKATMWNLLIIDHFFIDFFEKPRLKIILEFEGVLVIVGKPSTSLI